MSKKNDRLALHDGDPDAALALPPRPHPGYEPGRVSVLFSDGFDEPRIRAAVGPYAGRVGIDRLQPEDGFAILAVPAGEENDWIDRLSALDGVRCCSRTARS